MKSIAIEREFGSFGRQIGMNVAKIAEIPYYDTELLVKAAEKHHISVDVLKEYDEQKTGSFLYDLLMYYGAANQDIDSQQGAKAVYSVQETVARLAMEQPAVFIGRGATQVLRKHQSGKAVYIYCSDVKKKLKNIMDIERVSEAEARKLMEKKDKNRSNYFKYSTGKNWTDRKNYDLEINTAELSVEECSKILLQML